MWRAQLPARKRPKVLPMSKNILRPQHPNTKNKALAPLAGGESTPFERAQARHWTRAEWLAEGSRLFGPGETEWMKWRFGCPVCGHVQSPADFEAIGVEPQNAYQECIGRYTKGARDFGTKPGANGQKSPCDYAAYGLFRIGDTVQGDDPAKKPITVFPFATSATGPQAAQGVTE
jgi:hypothetical protein